MKLFENVNGNQFKKVSEAESDMSNPEEKKEIQIAREILNITSKYGVRTSQHDLPEEATKVGFDKIGELAQELIKMHGGKP